MHFIDFISQLIILQLVVIKLYLTRMLIISYSVL